MDLNLASGNDRHILSSGPDFTIAFTFTYLHKKSMKGYSSTIADKCT